MSLVHVQSLQETNFVIMTQWSVPDSHSAVLWYPGTKPESVASSS